MKTKIFGGIAIVAIAVAVAFNVSVSNQKQDKASMLALANVEALAQVESGDYCSMYPAWPGYCWRIDFSYSGLSTYCRKTGNPNDQCWY